MYIEELPLFDLIVLGIISFSLLLGIARGVFQELSSLFKWIVTITIVWFTYPLFSKLLIKFIHNDFLREFIAGTLIFICSMIILSIITNQIKRITGHYHLSSTDRLLGGLFGIGRGYLLCVTLLVSVYWLWEDKKHPPSFIQQGITRPFIATGAAKIIQLLSRTEYSSLTEKLLTLTHSDDDIMELYQNLVQSDTNQLD